MKKLLFITLALLLPALVATAANYYNYGEMTAQLKRLASTHSDLCALESKGKTLGGREIWLATVTKGNPTEHPAVLVVAGVEGADIAASELAVGYMTHLLENYGKVDSITNFINNTTIYVFPRVNPDATEAFWKKPAYQRSFNLRPMDLDYDGVVNEDGFDDINGDGLITQMRVRDSAGEWMADEKNPQLLRKADKSKGESGSFLLYTEGLDNDRDGQFNEDQDGGVNFDQNFAHNYQFFVPGAGVHQISEIESRAVADFCFSHPNIAMVFTFSRNENLIHPWQPPKGEPGKGGNRGIIKSVQKKDAELLKQLSEEFKKITGIDKAQEPERGMGAFNEWAYYHYGRWSLSAPAWIVPTVKDNSDSTDKKPGRKSDAKDPIARERNLYQWITQNKMTGSFVEWQKISHPDFPDKIVEVGGFVPYVELNPPADSLAQMGEKHNNYLTWLFGRIARIKLEEPKVEKLGKNVYRITARIVNSGHLPTNSEMGVKVQWARKVKVELFPAPGQKLSSGRKMILIDSIPGNGGVEEASWVVTGKGGIIKIKAGSPMVGFDEKEIKL